MPAFYLSPGVYVEEVPSAVRPIAGVGTSTAAFLGVFAADSVIPYQSFVVNEAVGVGDGSKTTFDLRNYPVRLDADSVTVKVNGSTVTATLSNDADRVSRVNFDTAPAAKQTITVTYQTMAVAVNGEALGPGDGSTATFDLKGYPVLTDRPFAVKSNGKAIQAAWLTNDSGGKGVVNFLSAPPSGTYKVDYLIAAGQVTNETVGNGDGAKATFDLKRHPVKTDAGSFTVKVGGTVTAATLKNDDANRATVNFPTPPASGAITVDYQTTAPTKVTAETVTADGTKTSFSLANGPAVLGTKPYAVRIDGVPDTTAVIVNDDGSKKARVVFTTVPPNKAAIRVDYSSSAAPVTPAGQAVFCTSFGDFKRAFGDFSTEEGQRKLAHGVYGFFNNGGTRCYVIRVKNDTDLDSALVTLEAIDDVALVAAPGLTTAAARASVVAHCTRMGDRFAILDSDQDANGFDLTKVKIPSVSDYAALYFPWIKVLDPVTKTLAPAGDGLYQVPPSGHVAGVYARVDEQRGVHKAPANEVVLGALDLRPISKAMQDGLNPSGINCIRNLNNSIRIWGARTMGGDANTEFKYVNVRRLFLFLRKSIDLGTQWVVFEPNDPALWSKITRNVTAFLLNVWRSGALFGTAPEQAFYVKCDAETNPPSIRDAGQVVTEIGVAVTKPAEFVVFRISQWAGPGK